MKTIHVCHPTTGFKDADSRNAKKIYDQVVRDHMAVPYTFSYFSEPVTVMEEGEERIYLSNLIFLSMGLIDELWVYGPIDEKMAQEIHIAYAKKIYIRCKTDEAAMDFEAMGLPQKKDKSSHLFWTIFIAIAVVSTILYFILFVWASQH